jgi:hypothetical protein
MGEVLALAIGGAGDAAADAGMGRSESNMPRASSMSGSTPVPAAITPLLRGSARP